MPEDALDFGAYLRLAREQKGRSLREIATATKISVLALEALERNDASRLPGGIFSRAFVRAYAKEVGLDPEDAVRRFVARFPDASMEETPQAYEANPEKIMVDEPAAGGRIWRAVMWTLPILAFVAYLAFGGRLHLWSAQPVAPDVLTSNAASTPPKPAQAQAPPAATPETEAPAANAVPSPTGTPEDSKPQVPGGQPSPGAPQANPVATNANAATSQPPVTAPANPSGGQVPSTQLATQPAAPTGSGNFHLQLAPRENCWVSVRVNGAIVYSGLMNAGQRQDLALHGDVSLTVGNAGVFSFSINGQPARSLGSAGQVVTVRLNADNLSSYLETR